MKFQGQIGLNFENRFFFFIFVRIGENIQSIFSVIQTSTIKIKIHSLQEKIKQRLKIQRVPIFISVFFKQILTIKIFIPFPQIRR